jgi:hypothetical protein
MVQKAQKEAPVPPKVKVQTKTLKVKKVVLKKVVDPQTHTHTHTQRRSTHPPVYCSLRDSPKLLEEQRQRQKLDHQAIIKIP